jgi:hypothetical protein
VDLAKGSADPVPEQPDKAGDVVGGKKARKGPTRADRGGGGVRGRKGEDLAAGPAAENQALDKAVKPDGLPTPPKAAQVPVLGAAEAAAKLDQPAAGSSAGSNAPPKGSPGTASEEVPASKVDQPAAAIVQPEAAKAAPGAPEDHPKLDKSKRGSSAEIKVPPQGGSSKASAEASATDMDDIAATRRGPTVKPVKPIKLTESADGGVPQAGSKKAKAPATKGGEAPKAEKTVKGGAASPADEAPQRVAATAPLDIAAAAAKLGAASPGQTVTESVTSGAASSERVALKEPPVPVKRVPLLEVEVDVEPEVDHSVLVSRTGVQNTRLVCGCSSRIPILAFHRSPSNASRSSDLNLAM